MLKKYHLFLLFLLPVLCWTACEKSIFNPQPAAKVLPPITMTGEGTFGCKINGEVFLHTPKAFDDHITVYYDDFRNDFQLQATESVDNNYNITIGIYSNSLSGKGIFELTTFYYRDYNNNICQTVHGLNEDNIFDGEPSQIEIIHFDPEARIISGTFQFTVVSEECQDTFRITEGRFDMPWVY
jgi:hypothetical protein